MLGEVHQPIGHLQVVDVEDRPVRSEGSGIFTMRVDHDHMALRGHFADLVQDQRRRGGLAGARRADQREVLAQHRVDVERAANVAGRIHRPDLDMCAVVRGVDLLQVGRGDREHLCARGRIAGHAAAEIVELARQALLIALAEEVDIGDHARSRRVAQVQRTDIGDDPRGTDAHLDLAADLTGIGGDRIGIGGGSLDRGPVEQRLAGRARDRPHDADRGAGERRSRSRGRPGRVEGGEARYFGHRCDPD
jgi:hypothetical protein